MKSVKKPPMMEGGKDYLEGINPPMNIFASDTARSVNDSGYHTSGGGGGGINYERLTLEMLANIDRRLSTLCTLIENLSVSLGVVIEGTGTFKQPEMINRTVHIPMEAVEKEAAMIDSKPILSGQEQHNCG